MNNDLFPNLDVKPDINAQSLKDDLIIPEENVKLSVSDQKTMKSQNDIFVSNKKTVEIPKAQMTETSSDIKSENGESENKTDRYAHLAKARAKGAETRRAKAEAKRKAKEEEKARKAEERRLRKEATMERNRQKARERYHRQKVIKEEEQKKIDKDFVESIPKPPVVNSSKTRSRLPPQKPSGMDFNTFAKYMMKYEQMKDAYQKSQKKPVQTTKKVTVQEPPKTKPYHPKNYPLSHLYGRKKKKQFFV
jgi:hypothetical protein